MAQKVQFDVGLILDSGSLVGKMCNTSISMALEDFYESHPNYTTRVVLHRRDSHMDVVGAASAAEKVVRAGRAGLRFVGSDVVNNSTDLESLGVSKSGAELLNAILKTGFVGLSGPFRLVDGELQSSAFEIINVIGRGGRRIGFWTPVDGLSRRLNSTTAPVSRLGPIMWPGETWAVPRGWVVPTSGRKMRIGVPVKNGFDEFVKVQWDNETNTTTVSGYCIDIFDAVMQSLPYSVPYEYVPFVGPDRKSAGAYNDMVYQVFLHVFPRGSPLVFDVSRAILNVTEGDKMYGIEKKWFGDLTTCPSSDSTVSSDSLSSGSFWGLFLITGTTTTLALIVSLILYICENWGELRALVSESSLLKGIMAVSRHYDQRHPSMGRAPTFADSRHAKVSPDCVVDDDDGSRSAVSVYDPRSGELPIPTTDGGSTSGEVSPAHVELVVVRG
ncbi:Glutamate receptor 2.3 [Acorus calamus]|uniref:Glutamate receptor 2.3 n=1 Tax=Acorus calamus TaxID=4465 RepID=A0AAV9CYD1_ACOCL|nr:Glutamate receptor 2.3 [Acorus calamus]